MHFGALVWQVPTDIPFSSALLICPFSAGWASLRRGWRACCCCCKRVRLEAARRAASPAERLLDDVLRLLDPMRPVDDEQAYQVLLNPCHVAQALCQTSSRRLPVQPVLCASWHARHTC